MEDDRGRRLEGRWKAGEAEVTVGSDRGGQRLASFGIHSLRSSCYIFYWGNKRTACYFHRRAIFLRAADQETRWKQEKNKTPLTETRGQATCSCLPAACLSAVAVLTLTAFGSKATADGESTSTVPLQHS